MTDRRARGAPLNELLMWLIRSIRPTGILARLLIQLAFRRIARPAHDLRLKVGKLQEASAFLESLFAGLSSALEALAGHASELVERGQHIVRLASGQETGRADFARTMSILEKPLAYLASARQDMQALAEDLQTSLDAVGRLLSAEGALGQAIAPLRSTQSLFSIESARLAPEEREIFGALAAGIGRLNEKVQQSLSDHFKTLSETHAGLQQTIRALDRQRREQIREVASRQEQIHRSLAALEREIGNNRNRDVQLTKASSKLAEEVGRAVIGLQTQDIVSQKLAHARTGLEEALQAVADCRTGGLPVLLKVPTLARIEAAQMEAVAGELEGSQAMLRSSVKGIASQLESFDGECLMLHEFGEITGSVNGAIQVLLDNLSGGRDLVEATLSIAAATEEMIAPVTAAAAGMTSTVDDVANEMRLISLNAQIQAIQIGQGTGLEVLAAYTAEISSSVTALATKTGEDLAETAARLQTNIERLRRMRELGQRELARLAHEGAAEEASLHECRDQMLAEVCRVGELLDSSRKIGARMFSDIDLSPAAGQIAEVREQVSQLVLASAALGPVLPGSNLASHAAKLARSYTMASERAVHHEALQGLGRQQADTPACAAVCEQGGAVELF